MPTTKIPGYLKLRGKRALDVQKKILDLRKEGHGVTEIVSMLKLSKVNVISSLYNDGARREVKQILSNAAVDCFIAFADSMEIARLHMETTNVLMRAGELVYTAEQFGTHARAIEKLADIFKLVNGRDVSMFKDAADEKKDPRLERAKERLKVIESQALNGTTIEAKKSEDDDDDE